MSATNALNGHQWPRYEQGEDDEHDVPISHYGIPVIYGGDEKDQRKYHRFHPANYVAHVPVEQLRAGQSNVDANHVARLSTIPAHVLEHDTDHLPQGVGVGAHLGGGYMLEDGHHRAAAAVRRGDTHVKMRVNGHYDAEDLRMEHLRGQG